MKRLMLSLAALVSLLLCQSALAEAFDMAKLKINFTGPVHNQAYFLCVSNNGCSRISAATQGKIYWMDAGTVNWIFAASMKNYTMRSQALPASCKVTVNKNQTLTVSGNLIVKNDSPYIGHLKCSVT